MLVNNIFQRNSVITSAIYW